MDKATVIVLKAFNFLILIVAFVVFKPWGNRYHSELRSAMATMILLLWLLFLALWQ